jgi:uncharacterized membrane protein YphA (DoxX/SURF4 family)
MDTVFVILQALLGLGFIAAGAMHLRAIGNPPYPERMEWLAAVPPTAMRVIAVLEMLGGLALLGTIVVAAPWLAALTAGCIALLMLSAIVFHLRRPGETPNAVFNAILGALALVVLYANIT